jgi:hypothetical protein
MAVLSTAGVMGFPGDVDSLCDKGAVFGAAIKDTLQYKT